jgi:transposase-like protein
MKGEEPMSELARRFGVSRKTAYKWVARYNEEGPSVRIPAESITGSGRSRSAIPASRSRRSEATLGVAYLADFG